MCKYLYIWTNYQNRLKRMCDTIKKKKSPKEMIQNFFVSKRGVNEKTFTVK